MTALSADRLVVRRGAATLVDNLSLASPAAGSIAACSLAMNSLAGSPGAIGGRNSTTIVPGWRSNCRRGQKRPELSASGTTGTPSSL